MDFSLFIYFCRVYVFVCMCVTYQTDIQKWNKYIDFSLFILFIYFLIVGLGILLMASSACMASPDECLNMNRVASGGGWIVREGRQITEWHESWLKTNNRWKKKYQNEEKINFGTSVKQTTFFNVCIQRFQDDVRGS